MQVSNNVINPINPTYTKCSDFYKMAYEMDMCGVGEGVRSMLTRFDFVEKTATRQKIILKEN